MKKDVCIILSMIFVISIAFTPSFFPKSQYVGIDPSIFHVIVQRNQQWCWVACVSMVFNYYRHPITQERMVTAVYGAPVNLPSGGGNNISVLVNRLWIDDHGKSFSAVITGLYQFDPGGIIISINNSDIIDSLENDKPLILGVGGHAVVMIGANYSQDNWDNIIIHSVKVADPWPGRGIYDLSGLNIIPNNRGGNLHYVVSIEITDEDLE